MECNNGKSPSTARPKRRNLPTKQIDCVAKAEQSRAEQSRAEQSRAEQSKDNSAVQWSAVPQTEYSPSAPRLSDDGASLSWTTG
ncbi:hypothetical protein LX36DRAFT_659536 [Colletotrichum falcatum]|nr:hypothetical protein LX36DRAFT_659536 [Colletotrichum falcatum]